MIVIAGWAKVKASEFDRARAAASAMAATSRAEDGCIDYRFSVDLDDPLTVRLFECWESQAALDAHFAMPHFAEFGAVFSAVVDGADFRKYEVSSSGPLFG